MQSLDLERLARDAGAEEVTNQWGGDGSGYAFSPDSLARFHDAIIEAAAVECQTTAAEVASQGRPDDRNPAQLCADRVRAMKVPTP